MSSPLDILARASRDQKPRRLTRKTNMVGEVLAYGDKAISVKILSGPIAGQEIEIEPKNMQVSEFSEPNDDKSSSYTPVGGILRFDNVEVQNGKYISKWVNAFIKRPDEKNKLLADQYVTFNKSNLTDSKGRPVWSMLALDVDNEKNIGSIDEMREALVEAFKTKQGAMLFMSIDGVYDSKFVPLPTREVNGKYENMDPVEHVEAMFKSLGESQLKEFTDIMENGELAVVPCERHPVGARTAAEIQRQTDKAASAGKQARIMQASPFNYAIPTIGSRVAGVMNRKENGEYVVPDVYVARLKEEFFKTAPQDARDGFNQAAGAVRDDIDPDRFGWNGVEDADLQAFFEDRGIKFLGIPKGYGWNQTSFYLKQYKNSSNFFVAKSHEFSRFGSPFPKLKCCEDLRKEYSAEIMDAVLTVAKEPAAEADNEASAAADASVEDEVETPQISPDEEAEIDNMLDMLGSEPMG